MEPKLRWRQLWQALGAAGDGSACLADLERRYGEPSRFYHNLAHIIDCLEQFDAAKHLAQDPGAVEMALWYHDAVYDSRARDNEERSAELAVQAGRAAGLTDEWIGRVRGLILVTRHQAQPEPGDAALMVDIDLSILGRAPRRFDEYEAQIRREYEWVPAEQFAAGRSAVLRGFLERPAIFSTARFREQFEKPARENMARSLAALQAQLLKRT